MTNLTPPAWIDITSPDAAGTRAFYSQLFGWRLQVIEALNYALVEPDAETLPGGIGQADAEHPAGILTYFTVTDLGKTLQQATDLGATVVRPEWQVPGLGAMAIVEGPDGLRFGLWQSE